MPIESRRVTYLSPQDDVRAALIAAAESATRSLHVLCYSFTYLPLAAVLRAKCARGLTVGVVADRSQSAGRAEKALLQELVDAGVEVTISTSHGALLHHKVLLVDAAPVEEGGLGTGHNDSFVVHGSYNFSMGAQEEANSATCENNAALCLYYWTDYARLRAYGLKQYEQLRPTPTEEHPS